MAFKRVAVIWLTPASTLATWLLLARPVVSQLSVECKCWPNRRKLQYQYHAQLFLSARPKTLPGTSSSKYITRLHGLLVEEGHASCLLAKSFWKLFPLENSADRYVSKLVKTKVDGLPSTCCRGASWIKGPKAPPWHVFKSSLLASLWCLEELTSGRPLDLAS